MTLFCENETQESCFQMQEIIMKAVLKPIQFSNPMEAVKEQLLSMLYLYNGNRVLHLFKLL